MNLFGSDDVSVWRSMLDAYSETMKQKASASSKKGKELLELDKWYQEELPAVLNERVPKYINHAEISKIMKWKLMRGKFRPRLQTMVESNSEDDVKSCSQKAFKQLPNLKAAIEALTPLKAIGPATASAILAAGCPEEAAFMADESVMAVPGLQPIQYTLNHYLMYAEQVGKCAKRLNKLESNDDNFWTAHRVELALFVSVMRPQQETPKNGEKQASETPENAGKRGKKRKSDG